MLVSDRYKLDGNKKGGLGFPEGKFYLPPFLLSFFPHPSAFSLLPNPFVCRESSKGTTKVAVDGPYD